MHNHDTPQFSKAHNISNLVRLLRWRARHQGRDLAYIFLEDGERAEMQMTYDELDRRARAIAATIQTYGIEGERVLLLYPPGLDYIAGFFGCLYAGAIAVPAYPPNPMRLDRTLPRLQALVADSQAKLALTTQPILALANLVFAQAPDLATMHWLASDTITNGKEDAWSEPVIAAETLAFLQYTSGSTQAPRGVTLTHGNLIHNLSLISYAFGITPEDTGVIWLPPYHDMGLIGGILQPVYRSIPVILLSPLAFLQRPMRWLRAVSHYKGSVSGGPNFAYDLCVRKATPEDIATLDLSHWQVAFNGAEPIRKVTLERFAETFAPAGFHPEAFYPCYGLAEATLIVSGGDRVTPPVVRALRRGEIQRNHGSDDANGSGDVQYMVSSGRTLPDQTIVITNPETFVSCPAGVVGEIWVKGPSVAQGYWNNEVETERTFGARLADNGDGPFLRTGDLGLMRDGELFVTGRIKDLIIIDGLNHYPQDIEQTMEALHPALRPGCSAAFSVSLDGSEHLVVTLEVRKQYKPVTADADTSRGFWLDAADIKNQIRRSIAKNHDLRVHDIILLQAGTIPKTSSGKVQHHATLAAYLADTLVRWDV